MIICSFVDATGSAVVRGKEWRWEFHHFLGPTFLLRNGNPMKTQPGEKHPVWNAFYDWYEAKYGPLEWREAERRGNAATTKGKNDDHESNGGCARGLAGGSDADRHLQRQHEGEQGDGAAAHDAGLLPDRYAATARKGNAEPVVLTPAGWRAAFIARMMERGVVEDSATANCVAGLDDHDYMSDPRQAADDEMSYWTDDGDGA